MQPSGERVLFLTGRVATSDSTALPSDVLVERVCNAQVRQQVYATLHGDFSMPLGSTPNPVIDATADPGPQNGLPGNSSVTGIPRHELTKCELRASASGFRSSIVSLVDLDTFGGTVNVGAIVVERMAKIEGATLSAVPYKAPNDARKAYEKGLEAVKNHRLAEARQHFEKAVEIYPKYAHAWYELGSVLQEQGVEDQARAAYRHATAIDTRFLPPYLSLASMAYEAQDWTEVVALTDHILELDPWNHRDFTGYMVDLDALNYPEAYFYNAVANYELDRIDDAEKSALKAQHLDLRTNHPQLHLLMAEIFAKKKDYASAISELQTFLQLLPSTKQAVQLREQLAEWEKLSGSASTNEKPDPQ